jgi:uncharacterized protein involved in outer membrane biogenesis
VRAGKAMVAGIALVALAAAAGAFAVSRVDPAAVKDFLADAARQATGREVVVRGATELELFPTPTLIAENVIFGNAPWSVSPDMARVKRLEARVDLLPLFLGELRVSRFRLVEPHVLLERDRKGRRNWDFDVAADPSQAGEFLASMHSKVRLVVSEIQILNGTFSYRQGKATYTINIPELLASGDVAGGQLELSGRGHFDGRDWRVTGSVGELSKLLRNQAYDLVFALTTPGITITAKGAVERPLDGAGLRLDTRLAAVSGRQLLALVGQEADLPGKVRASAVLSDSQGSVRLDKLDASLRIEGGRLTANGSVDDLVDLKGVNLLVGVKTKSLAGLGRIAGAELPEAGPVKASATITNPKGRFRMDKLSAHVSLRGASVELSGKLTHLARGRGLHLGVDLQATSLARLSRYLGVPLPAVGPLSATARLSLTKHGYKLAGIEARVGRSDAGGELYIYPHRKRPRVVGHLKSKNLDLDELLPGAGKGAGNRLFSAEPFTLTWLNGFDADVSVHARKLHIQSMRMDTVKAGMSLAEGRLKFTPKGRLGGGKFEARLSLDARAKRPHISLRIRGKGIGLGKVSEQIYATKFIDGAAADVNIDVAGRGNSVREFMASLSGGVYVAAGKSVIDNGKLAKISGDVVTAVLGTVAMQSAEAKTTHVRCSVVRVPVKNGIVRIDRSVAMETSLAAMSAEGSVDFSNEALDLGVSLVGRSGPSLSAGSFSGLVRVRGTLLEPQVGADAAGIAGAAATVAGAVATGGLSLLAQGIISQIAADRSTCRTALEMNTAAGAKTVSLGNAGTRDNHDFNTSARSSRERRDATAPSQDSPAKTMDEGS